MKKYVLALSLLMMFTLLNMPTATFAQTNDPNSIIKGFVNALNADDLEATLAYFADDAVITETEPGSDLTNVRNGKAQIREMYKEATAWKPRVSLVGEIKIDGDKVVSTLRFTAPPNLREAGVEYFDFVGEAVIQNGKIKALRSGMTEETMVNIQTAMSKAQASQSQATQPAAASAPATAGKDNDWNIWWLAAGGVVILLAGAAGILRFGRSPAQTGK